MSTQVKKFLKWGVWIVISGFILIQLIPTWLQQKNPAIIAEPNWDSQQTRELSRRACFDCHSNETAWPWYARVAPVSWLVTSDTVRGRQVLNFSEWGVSDAEEEEGEEAEESGELIQSGEMPPPMYLMLHATAKLSIEEKQNLIQGLEASLK